MNSEKEVIYFELNNWFSGEHYPAEEPFTTWIGNDLNIYFDTRIFFFFIKNYEVCK